MTRILEFAKIKNIRDLGTIKNNEGRVIKKGHLIRSANPCSASTKDCMKLKSWELDILIDFRDDQEKTLSEIPFRTPFPCEAHPVSAGNLTPDGYRTLLQQSSSEDIKLHMQKFYATFPVAFQPQYRSFLTHAEEGKKILFHCTAGKDRTGFGTALLLSALGVSYDVIMEDFLLSNHYFAETAQKMYQQLEKAHINPDVARPLLSVEPSYLDSAFSVIRSQYGSIDFFLNRTLNIDSSRLQQHYLV